ncbi:MAG: preprotein translocase subunit SecE [Mariniblastus sp.]|jgi:preprotein translocase subunit SecE
MSSMAKQKQESARGGLVSELFQFGLYKPNQGRVVRQVTFLTIALLGCLVAWEIKRSPMLASLGASGYLVMVALAAVIVWFSFRVVQYSVFADFLIAVEAEMNKVSWPTRRELWNASLVVMFVIFAMAAALFLFDAVWTWVFEAIGIRYSENESFFVTILKFFGAR